MKCASSGAQHLNTECCPDQEGLRTPQDGDGKKQPRPFVAVLISENLILYLLIHIQSDEQAGSEKSQNSISGIKVTLQYQNKILE